MSSPSPFSHEVKHLKAFLNAAGYWPEDSDAVQYTWETTDAELREIIINQVQNQQGLYLHVLYMVSSTLTMARLQAPDPNAVDTELNKC